MHGVYGSMWEATPSAPTGKVLCAGDLVLQPKHRGRGLFTMIMEYALADLAHENVAYLFNLSAGVSTRFGSLSTGWGSTAPIPSMRREKRPPKPGRAGGLLRRLGLSRPIAFTGPFGRIDHWSRRGGRVSRDILVSEISRPDAMADLVRRTRHDGRIRHVRDESYFAWRFGNPRASYRFFFFGRNALEGYLVLQTRLYAETPHPVRIVDCEATSQAARSALLAAAVEGIENRALEIWTGTHSSGDREALGALGFEKQEVSSVTEHYSSILVRPVLASAQQRPWLFGGRDVLDLASWDVRLLDSDAS